MQRLFLLLFFLTVAGFGCTAAPSAPTSKSESTGRPSPQTSLAKTIFTTFIINIHDWTSPEKSIATLNRIIDLHETYNVPVDLYLDDQVTQKYAQFAPHLLERMKTSPNVAVSYHLRPPSPYYGQFHEAFFDGLSDDDLYDRLMTYETHAIDLVTGESTDTPGGYQYVKDLMGYAPIVAARAEGNTAISKTLANVYRDLGAQFTLRHETRSALGSTANGLYLRPEDMEVKVYEQKGARDNEAFLESIINTLPKQRPVFLNLKWHEDDFYTTGTPWRDVYYTDETTPKFPPYDISAWQSSTIPKTEREQNVQWERYEDTLVYVTTHPDIMTAINAKDYTDLIESD